MAVCQVIRITLHLSKYYRLIHQAAVASKALTRLWAIIRSNSVGITIEKFPGARMSKASMKQALGSRVIIGSISDVMAWQDIFNGLIHVKAKYETHHQDIKPGRRLPEQYAQTLAALWSLILDLVTIKLRILQELTLVAPAWKDMWKAVPELSDETTTNFRLKNGDAVHYAKWW
ncbi:MAG: hypothetical protein Q9228_004405 [Teloschistes exilis]